MATGPKFLIAWLFVLVQSCTWSEGFFSGAMQAGFESLFQPWLSAALRMELEPKREAHELPDVKRLTTASYKGINYVRVENVSLGFAQAERYCENEFTDPMHLTSVQSEDEWHMLTTVFGSEEPNEMWLGGTVRRSHANTFVLHWLDSVPFTYHRFRPSERHRWMSSWRVSTHGCIIGSYQSNAQGNWSAVLTPCTEPRSFVCKETVKQSSSAVHFPANARQYDWGNLWNPLLLPPSLRPVRQRNRLRRPGHLRVQTTSEPRNVNLQPATENPQAVDIPTVTTSTELPSPTTASPDIAVSTSNMNTVATDTEPNPSEIGSSVSPQTTPQALSFHSDSIANPVSLSQSPKFTFFRTAPRALVEPADRTDLRLPQSTPATMMPLLDGTTPQDASLPSTESYTTSRVDESS